MREWVLVRKVQLVPRALRRWHVEQLRTEFAPGIRIRPTLGSNRADEHTEKMQIPRDLPPTQVSARGTAPIVRGEPVPSSTNLPRDGNNHLRRNTAFSSAVFRRELRIVGFERLDKLIERHVPIRMQRF